MLHICYIATTPVPSRPTPQPDPWRCSLIPSIEDFQKASAGVHPLPPPAAARPRFLARAPPPSLAAERATAQRQHGTDRQAQPPDAD